jgi:hypothetical protein
MKEKHGKEVREPREVPDGHRYCPMCQVTKLLEEFSQADMTTFLPITYEEHWAEVRRVDEAMGIEYTCN